MISFLRRRGAGETSHLHQLPSEILLVSFWDALAKGSDVLFPA